MRIICVVYVLLSSLNLHVGDLKTSLLLSPMLRGNFASACFLRTLVQIGFFLGNVFTVRL